MNFKKAKKYGGFTLIELLVVIAIIGLLSAVVLTSLSDARARAQDSAKNSEVREIITALELYFQTYGGYPTVADGTDVDKCLGYTESDGFCRGYQSGDNDLNTKIKKFLPGLKPNTSQVPGGYNGITYSCTETPEDGKCPKYQLIWYLANPKGECLGNAEYQLIYDILPKCTYPNPKNEAN